MGPGLQRLLPVACSSAACVVHLHYLQSFPPRPWQRARRVFLLSAAKDPGDSSTSTAVSGFPPPNSSPWASPAPSSCPTNPEPSTTSSPKSWQASKPPNKAEVAAPLALRECRVRETIPSIPNKSVILNEAKQSEGPRRRIGLRSRLRFSTTNASSRAGTITNPKLKNKASS
jgi:hypothetical protein